MDEGIQAHSPSINQTFRADTLAEVASRQRRETRERILPNIETSASTPSAASTSSVTLEDLSSISGRVATRRGRRRGTRRGRARSVSSVATPTRESSALSAQSFQDHWQVDLPAADDGGFGFQNSTASTFAQASTSAVQQEPLSQLAYPMRHPVTTAHRHGVLQIISLSFRGPRLCLFQTPLKAANFRTFRPFL